MITRAIWCWARVNFLKTSKLHEPVGRMQLQLLMYTESLKESCCYLMA